MKNYLSIIIAATMALFAASCGENYIDEPSTPDTDASAEMEIDSISSKSVFNYVYNDDVVEISDELAEWIMPDELTFSEKQEIRFKPGLVNHKELIPKIGQIIVSQPRGDQMPAGYMGRVTRTTPLGDAYVIDTEIVQLEDVYKDLDYIAGHFPDDATLWVGAIDPELNAHSYIVPGLGDAGDLAYGDKE